MDVSPCSNYIVTGGYNKSGNVFDISGSYNVTLPAVFDMKRGKQIGNVKKYSNNKKLPMDASE